MPRMFRLSVAILILALTFGVARVGVWAGSATVSIAAARSCRSDHFGKRYWVPRRSTRYRETRQTHRNLGGSRERPVG